MKITRMNLVNGALFLMAILSAPLAQADKTLCGVAERGHYFEIDNFNEIPDMKASTAWYLNGQLKKMTAIYPMSISSGTKVNVTLGSENRIARTSSFTAGPVVIMEDGSMIWATGSSDGKRQLILSKAFNSNDISDSDPRLNCVLAGAPTSASDPQVAPLAR